MPTSPVYDPDLVLTTGYPVTVIEGPKQPTEVCLGGVATSLPPQCGGPRLVGFNWNEHRGHFEEGAGVKFGGFLVEGRYDGTVFTVTKVVPQSDFKEPDADVDALLEERFKTPCPEPDGGWRVLDPSRTTDETQEQTFIAAEKLPGYAEAWVDQSRNPADGTENHEAMNDPRLSTINVRVTKDLAGAEEKLRTIWGGALCVSKAERTDKELRGIQEAMSELPGFTQSSSGDGQVQASVEYDDGSLQAWADRKYGRGLVGISSALTPVED